MREGAVQVVLELDRRGDMISGRLIDRQGGSRDFYGWMRLIALLEAVRAGEGPLPAPYPQESNAASTAEAITP